LEPTQRPTPSQSLNIVNHHIITLGKITKNPRISFLANGPNHRMPNQTKSLKEATRATKRTPTSKM